MSKDYKGCPRCKHFHFNGTCEAYVPEPIPFPIVAGQVKHTEPMFDQENDIVFELRDPSINVSELIRNAKERSWEGTRYEQYRKDGKDER
jgi:hypothetical protein